MVRPLSMDLRERAVARIAAGESVRKVARALSVAPSSVVKWTQSANYFVNSGYASV